MTDPAPTHASSTGQQYTDAAWLDVHFEADRPEYEAQLRAVGIQPGWHVLDAACGSGSFLPLLADLVGAGGRLAALDLAPDNVAVVERRVTQWGPPCPVEARVGTVLALPYADRSFDAVWFANTSQYLSDEELLTALAEFRRVVRPGGLVAIKETDGPIWHMVPAPPGLYLRFLEAGARAGSAASARILRAPELAGWLRRAGLVDVRQRGMPIERSTPLDPMARQLQQNALPSFAAFAATLELPAGDQEFWAGLRDPAGLAAFLEDPDFYSCEGTILVVGTVPDDSVG
jgi:ubiquinone/menaquinone biosynthesis C-methylase UbiE